MFSRSLAPPAAGSRPAPPPFVQQAESLRESGDLAGAEEMLARGLREHGASATGLGALAQVVADQGDAERAEALWRDALAQDGEYLPALRALADRAEAAGRRDEATEYYRRLIRLENAGFDFGPPPPAASPAALDATPFVPVLRAEPEPREASASAPAAAEETDGEVIDAAPAPAARVPSAPVLARDTADEVVDAEPPVPDAAVASVVAGEAADDVVDAGSPAPDATAASAPVVAGEAADDVVDAGSPAPDATAASAPVVAGDTADDVVDAGAAARDAVAFDPSPGTPSLSAAPEATGADASASVAGQAGEHVADVDAWDDTDPLAGFDLVLLDDPDDDLPALTHAAQTDAVTDAPSAAEADTLVSSDTQSGEPADVFVSADTGFGKRADAFMSADAESGEPADVFVSADAESGERADVFVSMDTEFGEPADAFVSAAAESGEPADVFASADAESGERADAFVSGDAEFPADAESGDAADLTRADAAGAIALPEPALAADDEDAPDATASTEAAGGLDQDDTENVIASAGTTPDPAMVDPAGAGAPAEGLAGDLATSDPAERDEWGAFGVVEVELEQPEPAAPESAAAEGESAAGDDVAPEVVSNAAGEADAATAEALPGADDAPEPFGVVEVGLEQPESAVAESDATAGAAPETLAEIGAPAPAEIVDEDAAPVSISGTAATDEIEAAPAHAEDVRDPVAAAGEDDPFAAAGSGSAEGVVAGSRSDDPPVESLSNLVRAVRERPGYAWPRESHEAAAAVEQAEAAAEAEAAVDEAPPPAPVWPDAEAARRAVAQARDTAPEVPAADEQEGHPFQLLADPAESDALHAIEGSGEDAPAEDGEIESAPGFEAAPPPVFAAAPAPAFEAAPPPAFEAAPPPPVFEATPPPPVFEAPSPPSFEAAPPPTFEAAPPPVAGASPPPPPAPPAAGPGEFPRAPRRQVLEAAAWFDAASRGASASPRPVPAASPVPAAIGDQDPWRPPPALTGAPSGLQLAAALVRAMELQGDVMRAGSSVRRLLLLAMGRELGLDGPRLEGLALAATLGDLGEPYLGDGAGPERATGAVLNLLSPVPLPAETVEALRGQHRRWDGGGDPDAPRQESLPFAARLLAVVRDAAARITGPGRTTPEAAVAELQAAAGTAYDPVLVSVLRRVFARREQHGIGYGVGGRVLVAHPHGMRAMEMAGRLHALGYEPRMVQAGVAEALDGGAVVAVLAAAPLALAEGDALRALRRDPATGALPVLVVDADTPEARVAALSAGADLTFPSAASFAEVTAALNALLRRAQALVSTA